MFGQINNGFDNDFEPYEFYLSPNHPNPFKEKTKIKYCVAYTTRVILAVFDSEGREILKLVNEEKNPGTYEVEFDTRSCHSSEDRNLTGDIVLCRLEAGDFRSEMKMILVK